jgi:hypothetical protein
MEFVKAISLWQPWASLMLLSTGYRKMFETRRWDTSYRGILLIHSAMRMPPQSLKLAREEPFETALKDDPLWSIRRGHVLGAVNLSKTHLLLDGVKEEILAGRPHEEAFGDYRNGRVAWECPDAVRFNEPFFWKGRQRFFDVPARSVLLATEQWDECPEWWPDASGCPGCLCETCRSYGD